MAEGVNPPTEGDGDLPEQPHSTELERVAHELEPQPKRELQRYEPYEQAQVHKFRLITAALAGFGLAAVAAAAIFLVAGRPPKPPQWSEWKPTAGGEDGLKQIADHIAPNYRMADGQQLVAVEGGPLQIAGLPVRVVLHPNANDYTPLSGKGALFILCGMGTKCSIKSGKPSVERMLLLRREALELALYAFRYLNGVHQVVVFMPPPPGQRPSQVVFLRKGDVKTELDRPLDSSLSPKAPNVKTVAVSPDAHLVDQVTSAKLFNYSLTQGNTERRIFVVLDPLTAAQRTAPRQQQGKSAQKSASKRSSGSSGKSSSR
jgi:hypothetical protein